MRRPARTFGFGSWEICQCSDENCQTIEWNSHVGFKGWRQSPLPLRFAPCHKHRFYVRLQYLNQRRANRNSSLSGSKPSAHTNTQLTGQHSCLLSLFKHFRGQLLRREVIPEGLVALSESPFPALFPSPRVKKWESAQLGAIALFGLTWGHGLFMRKEVGVSFGQLMISLVIVVFVVSACICISCLANWPPDWLRVSLCYASLHIVPGILLGSNVDVKVMRKFRNASVHFWENLLDATNRFILWRTLVVRFICLLGRDSGPPIWLAQQRNGTPNWTMF